MTEKIVELILSFLISWLAPKLGDLLWLLYLEIIKIFKEKNHY